VEKYPEGQSGAAAVTGLTCRGFLRLSRRSIVFAPERGRNSEGIDFAAMPPPPLISGGVILTVVDSTQRYGEFIAHLEG
jgi:hypothetical protein